MDRLFMEYVPSLSYALLAIGIALSPFTMLRIVGSLAVSNVFLLLAVAAMIMDLLMARARIWSPMAMLWGAGMMLVGFLSNVFINYGVAEPQGIKYWLILFYNGFVLPILIASQRVTSARQINRLIKIWLFFNLIGAVIVVCQGSGLYLPWIQNYLTESAGRMAGLTSHPNAAGFFISLVVPMCFACALGEVRWHRTAVWMVCTMCLLYAIDLCGSRTALVASAVGCLGVTVLFFLYQQQSGGGRTLLITGGGLLVIALLAGGSQVTAIARLLKSSDSTALADAERDSWNQLMAADFLANPLLGNGYYLGYVHNSYLGVLVISGLVGMFAQLLREFSVLSRVLSLLRSLPLLRSEFPIAVGLLMIYPLWLLSLFKNIVIIERNGFIALGLLLLFSMHLKPTTSRAATDAVPVRSGLIKA